MLQLELVSTVKDMSFTFSHSSFNKILENVSSVTRTRVAWFASTPFDQGIGSWDVSNVTDMSFMFMDATSFTVNQDIGRWDASSVKNTKFMLTVRNASKLHQNISLWDVSSVTTMGRCFQTIFHSRMDQKVTDLSPNEENVWKYKLF